jgi:hypothetical protein
VIADMVNCVIAGIGFLHAAGRLFVRERFSAGMNTVIDGAINGGSGIFRFSPKLAEYAVQKIST